MKLIIVLTDYRHASTTLCDNFNKLDGVISEYEIFNINDKGKNINIKNKIEQLFKNNENKTIIFKVMRDHLSYQKLTELLLFDCPKKIIILRRKNMKDSYKSYITARKTGNWGKNPDFIKYNNKNNIATFIDKSELSYDDYEKEVTDAFNMYENILRDLKINYLEIQFEDVINDKVDYEGIIRKF